MAWNSLYYESQGNVHNKVHCTNALGKHACRLIIIKSTKSMQDVKELVWQIKQICVEL